MSFNDCKISESQIQTTGVQSQPDTLTGSAADNKMVFDALPTLAIQKLNSLIDQMQQQAAAGQVGVTPFDGMTAQTLQEALEQIYEDIGGNYSGADGAGKVGYTPSEGVDEDTVQEAIEAVQANLMAYIAKIKAATGAAEVGNAPIAGMTATNVQQALEELRENIDNIVSGIIPGGSITSDMLQDGAVTADKLGSDVTGDTIPTSASDPTSISSQLSNRVSTDSLPVPGADCNTITKFGSYQINVGDVNSFDDRIGSIILALPWDANRQQQIGFDALGDLMGFRSQYGAQWGDWVTVATATPPQEFDLVLYDGFTVNGSCFYYKTQESVVHVIGGVNGSFPYKLSTVIGQLPAGFRPSAAIRGIAVTNNAPAYIQVNTNGAVVLYEMGLDGTPTGASAFFALSFVAAG